MKKPILIIVFLLSSLGIQAQENKTLPKKYISDIWREIIECNEPQYILNNVDIVFSNENYEELGKIFNTHPIIKTELEIGNFTSSNIVITNNLVFVGLVDIYLSVENVTFEKPVQIYPNSGFAGVSFTNCIFKSFLSIESGSKPYQIEFIDCKLNGEFNLDTKSSEKAKISISGCSGNLAESNFSNISTIQGNNTTELVIFKSHFASEVPEKSFIEIKNNLFSIDIDSTIFDNDISMNQLSVENSFSIKNSVLRNISLIDFVPPPSGGFAADWNQLSKKLCMISTHQEPFKYEGNDFYIDSKSKIYNGQTPEDLKDFYKFEKLTASYYNLLGLYKQRGNLKSANACYVEVKDLQTKMLGYEYKTNPTISSFFIWKTNQFLRYFCDYGTNPSKSVIISFYVILIFGGFYFFFYSAWDRINRSYFLNRYLTLSKYLSSRTTLGELYQSTKTREINSYTEFKSELHLKKKEVPSYVTFLGHVLYRFATSRFGLTLWIIKRLELHKDLWSQLKPGKKLLVGTIIGLSIFIFVIYTILIKSLSATMLSLNAFSTLGFGNIPVKGFSKYLTVVEGFLGWLLLSIFSVSLIAQMIQ